jgi:hypothetical protein
MGISPLTNLFVLDVFGTATMQSRPQPATSSAEFRWQVDCSGSFLRFDDPWDSTSQRGPSKQSSRDLIWEFEMAKIFQGKRFDLRILFGNRLVCFIIFYQLLEMMRGKHVPGKTTCLTEVLVFQGWVHKGLYDIVCSKSTRMCARYVHLPLAFDRWWQHLEGPTLTQQRAMVIRVITDQIWVPPKNRMSSSPKPSVHQCFPRTCVKCLGMVSQILDHFLMSDFGMMTPNDQLIFERLNLP